MYICIINDFMFIFGLFTLVNSDENIVICMTGNKRKEGNVLFTDVLNRFLFYC